MYNQINLIFEDDEGSCGEFWTTGNCFFGVFYKYIVGDWKERKIRMFFGRSDKIKFLSFLGKFGSGHRKKVKKNIREISEMLDRKGEPVIYDFTGVDFFI